MKWLVALAIGMLAVGSSLAWASSYMEVEYQRFYSHLRKLTGEDTQALQFAFGFVHNQSGQMCVIKSASIVTDKQTIQLDVSVEHRFTLPAEKALQLAEARVHIEFTESDTAGCDMSVQLETRTAYLKSYYSAEDLSMLVGQYEAFFNEMGSFLSFMMPSVKGLNFQFANPYLQRPLKDAPSINSGMLTLPTQWLNQNKPLILPEPPVRITAIASAD